MRFVFIFGILCVFFVCFSCGETTDPTGGNGTNNNVLVFITSPTNTQFFSSSNVTATGLAGSASDIEGVYLSINNASFSKVQGTSNWQFNMVLDKVTNTISVYAKDIANNYSSTNSVSFYVDPAVYSSVDLTQLPVSTVTQIAFNDSANYYQFPFNASAIIRMDHSNDSPNTTDGLPLITYDGNIYLNVVTKASNQLLWTGGSTDFSNYLFQGSGATQYAAYNPIDGWYVFVIDKTKIVYGINKLIIASTFRSQIWGGVAGYDFGITANALPSQAALTGNDGVKVFDAAYDISSMNTSTTWLEISDKPWQGIVNIGYRNSLTELEIFVKGSMITTNLIADSGNASTDINLLWAPLFIILGK